MSTKLLFIRVILVVVVVFISGCAFKNSPFPLGDSALVGYWFHEATESVDEGTLHTRLAVDIKKTGYISYHFISCLLTGESDSVAGSNTQSKMLSLQEMPIIRATMKKIKAQTFPLTPKWEFQIGEWPHKEGDDWLMELDKRTLTRVENRVDTSNWGCK